MGSNTDNHIRFHITYENVSLTRWNMLRSYGPDCLDWCLWFWWTFFSDEGCFWDVWGLDGKQCHLTVSFAFFFVLHGFKSRHIVMTLLCKLNCCWICSVNRKNCYRPIFASILVPSQWFSDNIRQSRSPNAGALCLLCESSLSPVARKSWWHVLLNYPIIKR